jgi:hypothetical protein
VPDEPRRIQGLPFAVALAAIIVAAPGGAAAAQAGDVIAVNNFGLPLWTRNFDTSKTTTIDDRVLLSEFMGAHVFVTDKLRVGMMLQWTEQYTGALPGGADHFTTFALLPQIGWVFLDHFVAAAIFTFAPRSGGKDNLDLGVQGLLGYGLRISRDASLNFAVELPYNFHVAQTVGLTPLLGLTYHL